MAWRQEEFAYESPRREAEARLRGALNAALASVAIRCRRRIDAVVWLVFNMTFADGGTLSMTWDEIGERLRISRDTAKRGGHDAAALDLLRIRETIGRGGQRANEISIDEDGIRAWAFGDHRRPVGHDAPAPGHDAPPVGHDAPAPGHDAPPSKEVSSSLPLSIPPSSPDRGDWGDLEVRAVRLGLAKASEAVELAIAGGASPADVGAVIDRYESRPGAWGPGALYNRIAKAALINDPDHGWPEPSETWRDAERQRRRYAEIEADRARRAAAVEQAALDRRRETELEARHGPDVDGLSDAELRALLGPIAHGRTAAQLRSGSWRGLAIETYAAKYHPPSKRQEPSHAGRD